MAQITQLSVGVPIVLDQNVIYALPSKGVLIISTLALEVSNLYDFSVKRTLAASSALLAPDLYVRCTTGTPTVSIKN